MNKKFLTLILIFIISLSTVVYADDINMRIADDEKNIRDAATVDVNYKADMLINSELLDAPIKNAVDKKREYESNEETNYKDLRTDVVVNLKGSSKKVSLLIGTDLGEYSDFVDNIIINADGMYCFVSPSDFSVKKSESNTVSLKINDDNNVIAKYNGTAQVRFLKTAVLCLFVFIALYILFFMLFYVRKTQFKEGFNVTMIYCMGGAIIVLSILIGLVMLIVNEGSFAEKKALKLAENDISFFNVDFENYSSEDSVNGIYLGVPIYNEGFNTEVLTACKKSDNSLESDKVIGGRYNAGMKIFKFPVNGSGSYYLKNNSVVFSDVNSKDEGLYEAVSMLASKNILSGKADGIYGVDDTLTRAESVTMFCKMLNIDEKSDSNAKFDDINNSDWFYNYVMAGKKYEILSGYDDNTFRAGNTITRQEFAAVLGQILQNRYGYVLPEDTSNLSVYDDSGDISFWALNYISMLEREGINIWKENYLPKNPITRGEAAMLLYRAYSMME